MVMESPGTAEERGAGRLTAEDSTDQGGIDQSLPTGRGSFLGEDRDIAETMAVPGGQIPEILPEEKEPSVPGTMEESDSGVGVIFQNVSGKGPERGDAGTAGNKNKVVPVPQSLKAE